jgi:uncharacterized protein DUF4062
MRVFISSVITGMESFREVAAAAARALDHEIIRAEDFSASPSSPRVACLTGVRAADVVIVLLGTRYGDVQTSGKSATHEEFDEAAGTGQVFIFIQTGVVPDAQQAALIKEARAWGTGHHTANFDDTESLRTAVTRALHRWERSTASEQIDPKEMAARALEALPQDDRRFVSSRTALAISIVGSPNMSILRPSELEDENFHSRLKQQALFGDPHIFETSEGTEAEVEGHKLILKQDSRQLSVAEDGSLVLLLPLPQAPDRFLSAIIHEDVTETLIKALGFAAQLLQSIDPTEKLSSVAVAVGLLGSNHGAWKTRAEQARNPNTQTMSRMSDEPVRTVLQPPHRLRAAF